jgi:hypothetical protein
MHEKLLSIALHNHTHYAFELKYRIINVTGEKKSKLILGWMQQGKMECEEIG